MRLSFAKYGVIMYIFDNIQPHWGAASGLDGRKVVGWLFPKILLSFCPSINDQEGPDRCLTSLLSLHSCKVSFRLPTMHFTPEKTQTK